jgi:hypothetical protein
LLLACSGVLIELDKVLTEPRATAKCLVQTLYVEC